MIRKFIHRLFLRIYWFYDQVIKESNQDLRFYFTTFAISFLLFFYINFILALVYVWTRWSFLNLDRTEMMVFIILFLALTIYSFYQKKNFFLKKTKTFDEPFGKGDVAILAYVIIGLYLSYYTIVFLNKNHI